MFFVKDWKVGMDGTLFQIKSDVFIISIIVSKWSNDWVREK